VWQRSWERDVGEDAFPTSDHSLAFPYGRAYLKEARAYRTVKEGDSGYGGTKQSLTVANVNDCGKRSACRTGITFEIFEVIEGRKGWPYLRTRSVVGLFHQGWRRRFSRSFVVMAEGFTFEYCNLELFNE